MVISRICDLPINSSEDLTRVLDCEETRTKVAEIESNLTLLFNPTIFFENLLEIQPMSIGVHQIGSWNIEVYNHLLGYFSSLSLDTRLDGIQSFCEKSIQSYQDELTPLFVQSLKCHQQARSFFIQDKREEGRNEIARTRVVANEINSVYQRLGQQASSLRDSFLDLLIEIQTSSLSPDTNKREALQKAITPILRTQELLLSANFFCRQMQHRCQSLKEPELDDPFWLEVFSECQEESFWSETLILQIADTLTPIETPDDPQSLNDVMQSMKSGHAVGGTRQNEHPFVSSLQFSISTSMQIAFQKSYFSWLAFAQKTEEWKQSLEGMLDSVKIAKYEIDQIRKDPLATALELSIQI